MEARHPGIRECAQRVLWEAQNSLCFPHRIIALYLCKEGVEAYSLLCTIYRWAAHARKCQKVIPLDLSVIISPNWNREAIIGNRSARTKSHLFTGGSSTFAEHREPFGVLEFQWRGTMTGHQNVVRLWYNLPLWLLVKAQLGRTELLCTFVCSN